MPEPSCHFCDFLERRELVLLDDEKAAVLMNPEGKVAGQLLVIPKEHSTILEQVPDFVLGRLGALANRASSAIFEALGATGTNIMVANGVAAGQVMPHFAIHVIPRDENDGIALQWEARKADEEQLSTAALQLQQFTQVIGDFGKEKKLQVRDAQKAKAAEQYLLDKLRRIP